MPATQAQVDANRANALKSTEPSDSRREGRLPGQLAQAWPDRGRHSPPLQREAAEVDRRASAFESELRPSGELGLALVRRDRGALGPDGSAGRNEHETAALTERVRQAEADFVVPEGLSPTETHRLLVGRQASPVRPLPGSVPGQEVRAGRRTRLLPGLEGVAPARGVREGGRSGDPGAGIGFVFDRRDDRRRVRRPLPRTRPADSPGSPSAERPEPIAFATRLEGRVDVPIHDRPTTLSRPATLDLPTLMVVGHDRKWSDPQFHKSRDREGRFLKFGDHLRSDRPPRRTRRRRVAVGVERLAEAAGQAAGEAAGSNPPGGGLGVPVPLSRMSLSRSCMMVRSCRRG